MTNTSVADFRIVRKDQVDLFASLGCSFVLLNGKKPIEDGWQDKPRNVFAADKHIRKGGNVGVHGGKHSDNLVWLDVDVNAQKFLDTFPNFRGCLTVTRSNAPDKAKFAVKITDRLPRSQKWITTGEKAPRLELLSTGNQAAVIGMHPSGVPYEHNSKQPIELTYTQLSYIWRRWTGTELNDPTRPTAKPKPTQPATSNNDLASKVKAHWDCVKVFAHFGLAGEVVEDRGELRILGNGGLLVKPDSDVFYTFADEIGGDCINAWAWCKTGNAKLDKATFTATCYEMLETAGAMPPKPERTITLLFGEGPIELPFDQGIAVLRQKYTQHDCYPKGPGARYDRSVMLAFLDRCEVAGSTEIKFDVRTAGELSGMGFMTACKAIHRLIEHGYLEHCDKPSWFIGATADERDQHIVNQFEAYAYRLTPVALDVCALATVRSTSAGAMHCIEFAHIDEALDTATVERYLNHDAFQYGAKSTEDDPDSSLGKIALDMIAALTVSNDLSFAELAESTGASRTSISKKARLLELFGLVELYKVGRSIHVYLVDGWEEVLERVWLKLTTFARTIKRKIGHLEARLERARTGYWRAISGALRSAISKLIDRWKAKLFTLNRQLAELTIMRRGGAL